MLKVFTSAFRKPQKKVIFAFKAPPPPPSLVAVGFFFFSLTIRVSTNTRNSRIRREYLRIKLFIFEKKKLENLEYMWVNVRRFSFEYFREYDVYIQQNLVINTLFSYVNGLRKLNSFVILKECKMYL